MEILKRDEENETPVTDWPADPKGWQVGDEVLYVPGKEHALNSNPKTGETPWVIGKVVRKDNDGEVVQEIDSKALTAYREYLSRLPADPEIQARERAVLRMLRPREVWRAAVRRANPDGTYALDIESNQGGVTLHYDRVPHDHTKQTPHSCHKGGN